MRGLLPVEKRLAVERPIAGLFVAPSSATHREVPRSRAPFAPSSIASLHGWLKVGPLALTLAGACALGQPQEASAQAVRFTARTVFHGYQVQLDPRTSDALRDLNRFYAAVEGTAFQLGPEGQFDVVASFRYDTDFGNGFDYLGPYSGNPDVNDVDLLYLYVDWRNMIGREFDLRVGRQFEIDDLDWYVFDGLKLMGHLWRDGEDHFDLDIYGGLPVRYDALFSSADRLLGDGTEVYDGEDPFGGLAVGATAFLRIFRDLSLSLSWRNELVFREESSGGEAIGGFGPAISLQGDSFGQPVGMPGQAEAARLASAQASEGTIGLQESLVGGSIGCMIRTLNLTIQLGGVYDLLTENLDRGRASLSFDPLQNLHLGFEFLRVRPRFVGDSIFNWFNIFPYDRARVEGSWSILDERLTLQAQYFFQAFRGEDLGGSGSAFEGEDVAHGPGGGISWQDDWGGVSAYGEGGTNFGGLYAYGGNYALAWLAGQLNFLGGRLQANGRISVTSVQEDWVVGVDQGVVDETRTTYTLTVGAGGQVTDWLRARAFYVQNVDPVLEGNYRVFTELAVLYR